MSDEHSGYTYRGRPIEELTYEELLTACKQLIFQYQRNLEQASKDIASLNELHRMSRG